MKIEFCAACGIREAKANELNTPLSQWQPIARLDSITLCSDCLGKAGVPRVPENVGRAMDFLRQHLDQAGYGQDPEPSHELLAKALNEAGHLTLTGRLWTAASVFKLLRDQATQKGDLWMDGAWRRRQELDASRPPAPTSTPSARPTPTPGEALASVRTPLPEGEWPR